METRPARNTILDDEEGGGGGRLFGRMVVSSLNTGDVDY